MDSRQIALSSWLEVVIPNLSLALAPTPELRLLSGDASFRRYFRIVGDDASWIAVDAPPEHENSRAFVAIANSWLALGVPVPEVLAADLEQGFMLLSDLGDDQYLTHLLDAQAHVDAGSIPTEADQLYRQALDVLIHIQRCHSIDGYALPDYDAQRLNSEMELFPEWFVGELLKIELSENQRQMLNSIFYGLTESALAQPQVCVHRDYHSRNLMLDAQGKPAVLDFQDAVWGPVTYDAVSLLKDCYISWPREQQLQWLDDYQHQAVNDGVVAPIAPEKLHRWFDWMGMQRHFKAVGIFARLQERDGKGGYLGDIPRTLAYMSEVAGLYPELSAFNDFLNDWILPAMHDSGMFSSAELSLLRSAG